MERQFRVVVVERGTAAPCGGSGTCGNQRPGSPSATFTSTQLKRPATTLLAGSEQDLRVFIRLNSPEKHHPKITVTGTNTEAPKCRLSWKPAPSKVCAFENAPPFLAPFGFRPKIPPSSDVEGMAAAWQLELPACDDGVCEKPSVNQSAVNLISDHGTS